MANTKSAIKREKIRKLRTMRNKAKRSELRTYIRRYNEALAANSDNKEELLKLAIKKLDKAASKNIIHKNKASRKKSQLMKALNAVQAAE
ncbi:MAG: 30S ribosomal protein S20 [Clostridiaceae bacterium]|nr:30S ribosomal protein S20 [Clostridiaceae bacterium]